VITSRSDEKASAAWALCKQVKTHEQDREWVIMLLYLYCTYERPFHWLFKLSVMANRMACFSPDILECKLFLGSCITEQVHKSK
jgi:hypothetical protein